MDKQKPWLKTVNRNTTVYDDNLELLRNRDLHQSTYSKLQDFYFLLQTNFDSPTAIDLRGELQQAKQQAMESLDAELAWLDSLRNGEFISEQTGDFYSAKAKFERGKLDFFDKEDGEFNETSALQHYLTGLDESSKHLQTIYLDEFSDFLFEQITPDDPYEILHPEILGANPSPFGKRLLFKILQRSLPYLPFQKADEWLTTYAHQLANTEQAKFLKDRIDNLREERPDMDLMGIGNRRISFEELLERKRGKYLYVDLWAAWCIPCIKAFPALRELHEAYKDRGVEIIHLTVDHNHKFWEEVVRKYEIADPNRSFIALNLAESNFLQKLDVAFIPRYLIFDSRGKLLHPHAPGPESKEIVRLFGEVLSE